MDPRILAERFGFPIYEELSGFPLIQNRTQLIPYGFAKQRGLIPIETSEQWVKVALCDPLNREGVDEARLYLKKTIHPVYCPKQALESAIEFCYQQKEGEAKRIFSEISKDCTEASREETVEGYDLLGQAEQNPTIRMVNALFLDALQQGASDLHLEPGDGVFHIRYRIDGVLFSKVAPPKETQAAITTRIKVMAKMDIAEQRLPQDGRIKLFHGGREIDFRVSTIPTVHGERLVLRILDRGNVLLGLEKLGMGEALLAHFRKLLFVPEGIVLVTGPTGSGKTTTLYSALAERNRGEINILTIEDPVEYKLPGIAQMNVNPRIGLTFAQGLRHILRQDPDVIMIGEIRDKETAEIAIQASLTGHLVFSTLHTNDAPSALTRLSDMGIEPYLLASSLLGVLAQRLVRCICANCCEAYVPHSDELAELHLKKEQLAEGKLFRGMGCAVCFGSGYRGRHGIYELMPMQEKMKHQILKSADAQELRKTARALHMTSLFEQGVQLVIRGLTTSAEILRVTRMTD